MGKGRTLAHAMKSKITRSGAGAHPRIHMLDVLVPHFMARPAAVAWV